ncbi:MAG TPA: hypothetical protein VFV52_17760 [Bacilli bacterium]|nr:hypothetical protein [Bacilli bacterium]
MGRNEKPKKVELWKQKADAYYEKTSQFELAKDLKKAGFRFKKTKKA